MLFSYLVLSTVDTMKQRDHDKTASLLVFTSIKNDGNGTTSALIKTEEVKGSQIISDTIKFDLNVNVDIEGERYAKE